MYAYIYTTSLINMNHIFLSHTYTRSFAANAKTCNTEK